MKTVAALCLALCVVAGTVSTQSPSTTHQATLQQYLRHLSQPAPEDRRPRARCARPREPRSERRDLGKGHSEAARCRHAAAWCPAARPGDHQRAHFVAGRRTRSHEPDHSRAAGVAQAQSRRVRQRHSRSARPRRRCDLAAPAGRVSLRLRQRRRRAGELARVTAGLSGRGEKDQRRGRRRPAHQRRQRHVQRATGSVAGRASRGAAARHRRRDACDAHLRGRRRVPVPGSAVSHATSARFAASKIHRRSS